MTRERANLGLQRYPPNSAEAEQSVLGGLMIDNAAWHEVSSIIGVDDFYSHDHRLIFYGISDLCEDGEPCDFVTLSEKLKQQGNLEEAGGLTYLGMLAADTPSAANVRAYAEIVREKSIRRQLISVGQGIAELGYNGDGGSGPQELLNRAGKLVSDVQARRIQKPRMFRDILDSGFATIEEARQRRLEGRSVGIPTGIGWLDRITGGFRPGQLVVISARPGVGKSALLNQFMIYSVGRGGPGLVHSLEMGEDELAFRALSHVAQVNITRLSFGADHELMVARDEIARRGLDKLEIYFDTESFDLHQILGQIALHQRQFGIKWAAVDLLNLIEAREYPRMIDRMTAATREFKKLGKQLGIPIIVLAHMNRGVEKEQRRPRLSDLRECGTIEQDANMVIFLHTDAADGEKDPIVEFIVAKNRGGRRGTSGPRYQFQGQYQTFVDIGLPDSEETNE